MKYGMKLTVFARPEFFYQTQRARNEGKKNLKLLMKALGLDRYEYKIKFYLGETKTKLTVKKGGRK